MADISDARTAIMNHYLEQRQPSLELEQACTTKCPYQHGDDLYVFADDLQSWANGQRRAQPAPDRTRRWTRYQVEDTGQIGRGEVEAVLTEAGFVPVVLEVMVEGSLRDFHAWRLS